MEEVIVKSLITIWLLWAMLCVGIMVVFDVTYAPKWAEAALGGWLAVTMGLGLLSLFASIWTS